MKKYIGGLIILVFLFPGVVSAQSLTNSQIWAVVGLLQAFNVNYSTIVQVQNELMGTSTEQVAKPVWENDLSTSYPIQRIVPVTDPISGSDSPIINTQSTTTTMDSTSTPVGPDSGLYFGTTMPLTISLVPNTVVMSPYPPIIMQTVNLTWGLTPATVMPTSAIINIMGYDMSGVFHNQFTLDQNAINQGSLSINYPYNPGNYPSGTVDMYFYYPDGSYTALRAFYQGNSDNSSTTVND